MKRISLPLALSRSLLLGIIMIVAGLVILWSRQANEKLFKPLDQALKDSITIVDANTYDEKLDGKPVLVTGVLTSPVPLGDELLKPGPYILLERESEMYQWSEYVEKTEGSSKLAYKRIWSSLPIDFFSFQEPSGHENPLMKYKPVQLKAEQVTFGAFDAEDLIRQFKNLENLQLTPSLLQDPEIKIEENKLFIKREKESANTLPALGDTRVWYNIIPQGPYTILGLQASMGRIEPGTVSGGESFFVIRPGMISLDEILTDLGNRSSKASWKIWLIGMALIFFGFCSLLSPWSDRISLKPYSDRTGAQAVMLMSLFLSVVITFAVFVMMVLG